MEKPQMYRAKVGLPVRGDENNLLYWVGRTFVRYKGNMYPADSDNLFPLGEHIYHERGIFDEHFEPAPDLDYRATKWYAVMSAQIARDRRELLTQKQQVEKALSLIEDL